MFRDQFRLKSTNRVRIDEDRLGIVLRLETGPARLPRDDEGAFPRC
jgi:hypothetical protein